MSRQSKLIATFVLVCLSSLPAAGLAADVASKSDKAMKGADPAKVARGKYLVRIAGCNDCHTPGYMVTAGKVEEKLWLTGESFGWRGPWGTTYAPNLRLYFDKISEDQWVKIAQSVEMRPPMPWFALRAMTEADLRAIYAYARSLGPAGKPAPAYLPPDKVPPQPYAQFPSPPPAKK